MSTDRQRGEAGRYVSLPLYVDFRGDSDRISGEVTQNERNFTNVGVVLKLANDRRRLTAKS
jgi:hypothetical protein